MSVNFINETGYILAANTAPGAAIYMNQYPSTTVVVDITITPIGANTIPLKVTIQISGQIFELIPIRQPDETYRLQGIIVRYLEIIRAIGNPFTFKVTGLQETNVLPAGMDSIATANALREDHYDRPLGWTETVALPSAKWGSCMDVWITPFTGSSSVAKRFTLSVQYPTGGTYKEYRPFDVLPITAPMVFRKLTIPPGSTVKGTLYGNIAVYYQWAWQRIGPTPDL